MNRKTKKIFVISITAIVVSIMLLLTLGQPTIINKSFQTLETGNLETTVYECNFACKIIQAIKNPSQQTVFFSTSEFTSGTLYQKTVNVGTSVTLYTRAACSDYSGNTNNDAYFTLYQRNEATGDLKTSPRMLYSNAPVHTSIYKTSTFTPTVAGTWKFWDRITCYKVGTTTQTYDKTYDNLIRTLEVVSAPIACPESKLVRTCSSDSNQPLCNSDASSYQNVLYNGCEEWSQYNGDSCIGSALYKNCKTTCKSNAYCDNSYSSQICDGKVNCVVKVEQTCPSGTTGTFPNCNPIPIEETCPSGTTGTFPDCTIIPIEDNQTIPTPTCEETNTCNIDGGDDIINDQITESNIPQWVYYVIGIIIGGLLLTIIVLVIRKYSR